jgi:hypothetical protein
VGVHVNNARGEKGIGLVNRQTQIQYLHPPLVGGDTPQDKVIVLLYMYTVHVHYSIYTYTHVRELGTVLELVIGSCGEQADSDW